jgi:hypothetical protein
MDEFDCGPIVERRQIPVDGLEILARRQWEWLLSTAAAAPSTLRGPARLPRLARPVRK